MTGVVFVFVREDASEVEILAEAFDAAGHSITGCDNAELSIVIWSRRALHSDAFRMAVERTLRSGKAIVAALSSPPSREAVFEAPVIDLSQWDGVDGAVLGPLLEAAEDMIHPLEADVLPSRAVETPPVIASAEIQRAPAQPKLGAPAPRLDFRRVGGRRSRPREHAALAFLMIALLGGGALVVSVASNTMSYEQAERANVEEGGGVSLPTATAEAIGVEDIEPEAPPQIVRRGVEPPSARTVRRAGYAL